MGYGYAVPYMRLFRDNAERSFISMAATGGVHRWPEGKDGLTSLCHDHEWPFETESLDRILIVHGLEHAESPDLLLQEAWRCLKSNGRLLLVVPNRLGLWARTDRTPMGHGYPYTAGQLTQLLKQNMFVVERSQSALFMPPFKSFFVMRTAFAIENIGKFIFPGLAGVQLIEAGKQIYGLSGGHKKAHSKSSQILVPDASAV